MNHVQIPKDPDSSVQLRPLVCFNEGMRSPYDYNPGDNMKSELAFSGVEFEKYAREVSNEH